MKQGSSPLLLDLPSDSLPARQLIAQIDRLLALGYPSLLGMDEHAFQSTLAPLACHLPPGAETLVDLKSGTASFVLVINAALAPVSELLPRVERNGKTAIERLYPVAPERFTPIESVSLPSGQAYLLLDIDRGNETLNVTPDAAMLSLNTQGRSPLTIEEGIALLTHFPEFLQPNQCFSLLGSRCGDKRVPALWLSQGAPKLGWCWAGNPHTWLGSASCGGRSEGVDLSTP